MKPLNKHILEKLKIKNDYRDIIKELFNECEIWMDNSDNNQVTLQLYFVDKFMQCHKPEKYNELPLCKLTPIIADVNSIEHIYLVSIIYTKKQIELKYYIKDTIDKNLKYPPVYYAILRNKEDLLEVVDEEILIELTEKLKIINTK